MASTPSAHGVILDARGIVVSFRRSGGPDTFAVDHVDVQLSRGETLGLVGESGSGKSSLGRSLVLLPPPTSGSVLLGGDRLLTGMSTRQLRRERRRIQMIFQDPLSSLNPRRAAEDAVAEPMRIMGDRQALLRAQALLSLVGIDAETRQRRPHQLSGGQCQRVSIARAIIQEPEVLICDEPVSALDVSVQARVLNLLEDMKRAYHLSMIFISHDLAVVAAISDRVAVMYLGRVVEIAPSPVLYRSPAHHYTRLLLDSIPSPDGPRASGAIAADTGRRERGPGCHFAPRCPAATDPCRTQVPPLRALAGDHLVACHHPLPGEAVVGEPNLGSFDEVIEGRRRRTAL